MKILHPLEVVDTSAPAAAEPHQRRKAHARTIIAHVEAAKARKSGTNITDLSRDELIADLLRHRG